MRKPALAVWAGLSWEEDRIGREGSSGEETEKNRREIQSWVRGMSWDGVGVVSDIEGMVVRVRENVVGVLEVGTMLIGGSGWSYTSVGRTSFEM